MAEKHFNEDGTWSWEGNFPNDFPNGGKADQFAQVQADGSVKWVDSPSCSSAKLCFGDTVYALSMTKEEAENRTITPQKTVDPMWDRYFELALSKSAPGDMNPAYIARMADEMLAERNKRKQ